ncbi:hypothetical protein C7S15_4192 [Burkholderia cepacia]|nr:hypothetical protein [Burkholderia cepacia]
MLMRGCHHESLLATHDCGRDGRATMCRYRDYPKRRAQPYVASILPRGKFGMRCMRSS